MAASQTPPSELSREEYDPENIKADPFYARLQDMEADVEEHGEKLAMIAGGEHGECAIDDHCVPDPDHRLDGKWHVVRGSRSIDVDGAPGDAVAAVSGRPGRPRR